MNFKYLLFNHAIQQEYELYNKTYQNKTKKTIRKKHDLHGIDLTTRGALRNYKHVVNHIALSRYSINTSLIQI
jgi:hypothetical protein